jgi:monoamine oxidase
MSRPDPSLSHDAIVIGAGVAGLAAARALAAGGRRVLVLEARTRIGGRIATIRSPEWPGPVELGAEFVHGGNPAFWKFLRQSRLVPEKIADHHAVFKDGRLRPAGSFWKRLNRVMEKIDEDLPARTSFKQFLQRHKKDISPEDAILARSFVEGFEAAPWDRMSARSLAGGLEHEEQFRFPGGYDQVVEALRGDLPPRRVSFLLGRTVTRIRWRRGRVEVISHGALSKTRTMHSARAAVVTLPLGVLQARAPAVGAVEFSPPLRERRALLDQLEVGHAFRIALLFRRDFWRDQVARTAGKAGFVHSLALGIPVWWSLTSSPVLVGWAGGPRARELDGLTAPELMARVLGSLRALTGAGTEELRTELVDARLHRWSADPFTRGAYSFSNAGFEDAPLRLRQTVEGTLFFAGEATADTAELGTVHGAFASGLRAAGEVLQAAAAPKGRP